MFEKLGVRNNLIRLVKSNFSLYRIILISIVICYEFECLSVGTIMKNPNIKFIIAMRDISLLLLLPLLISLFVLLINYLKGRLINKKMSEEYYRDILNEISCTELTYIDDNNVELKKDIVATLLELNLKKKIKFENNKIIVIDKKNSKFTEHEKYVLRLLHEMTYKERNNNYSILKKIKYYKKKSEIINGFQAAIFEDLKKSKVIEEKSTENFERRYRKIKIIVLVILMLILLFFGSGDLHVALCLPFGALIFSFIWCLIKIPMPKWGPITRNLFFILFPCIASCIIFGLLMIPMIVAENQEEVIILFKYFFIAIAVIIIGIESYIILNNKKLTTKGKDIKRKLCGLKMYLNDFSTMKSKDINEIGLWDEYIIYSVVLNENKKITRKVMRLLKNTIVKN